MIRSKEYMDDDEKQQLEQKVCNSHFADWGLRVPTLEGRQKRHWGVRSSLVSSGLVGHHDLNAWGVPGGEGELPCADLHR